MAHVTPPIVKEHELGSVSLRQTRVDLICIIIIACLLYRVDCIPSSRGAASSLDAPSSYFCALLL